MAIDPVCGMEVNQETATLTSVYNSETYYFCAPGCKHIFEKDPQSFTGPDRKPFIPMSEIEQRS